MVVVLVGVPLDSFPARVPSHVLSIGCRVYVLYYVYDFGNVPAFLAQRVSLAPALRSTSLSHEMMLGLTQQRLREMCPARHSLTR